jgi:hypothetical protein
MNCVPTHLRASQGDKIRELRRALINAGFVSLDQQAIALDLPRSTTWAILKGDHKCSGLRGALVARMWSAPKLPPAVQRVLADYVIEKSRGAYGHTDAMCRRFIARFEAFANLDLATVMNVARRALD